MLALGRIEFLHPGFHTDRRLWPVGYAAQRLAASPASGGREAAHLCEVLAAPDGSGPLFRCVCGQAGLQWSFLHWSTTDPLLLYQRPAVLLVAHAFVNIDWESPADVRRKFSRSSAPQNT